MARRLAAVLVVEVEAVGVGLPALHDPVEDRLRQVAALATAAPEARAEVLVVPGEAVLGGDAVVVVVALEALGDPGPALEAEGEVAAGAVQGEDEHVPDLGAGGAIDADVAAAVIGAGGAADVGDPVGRAASTAGVTTSAAAAISATGADLAESCRSKETSLERRLRCLTTTAITLVPTRRRAGPPPPCRCARSRGWPSGSCARPLPVLRLITWVPLRKTATPSS